MRRNLETAVMATLTCLMVQGVAFAADPATPPNPNTFPGNQNSGVIMNQNREYFERQRIAREIEEGKKQLRDGASVEKTETSESPAGISFELKEILLPESKVLTKEELNKITEPYLNKEANLQKLYDIVNAINKLYSEKGYVTCKAVLVPQTVKDGVVKIDLVEGRVGEVIVGNNKSTKASYIKNRLPLKKDEVSNLEDLNRDLLWFNGTNDVQLRIQLRAGQAPGTTDYVIAAIEPQQSTFGVFVDNSGSENTGLWREGLSYVNRSLTGNRDMLVLSGMMSEGTKSGAVSYDTPVSKWGTRLGVNYSANSVDIVDGPMEAFNTVGHSTSYGVRVTQPLAVKNTHRSEAFIDWNRQNSQTDYLGMKWIDDELERVSIGASFTNYGNTSVCYHRHAYTFGTWEDIVGAAKHYGKYTVDLMAQYLLPQKHIVTVRMNGQWSGSNYLPSAEQFYLGGVYSVRGYEENILGADSGYSVSAEYSVPVDKGSDAFVFLDWGKVYGDNAFDEDTLIGTGLGYRTRIAEKINASFIFGVPLEREVNATEVSKTRIHFMLNGQF